MTNSEFREALEDRTARYAVEVQVSAGIAV